MLDVSCQAALGGVNSWINFFLLFKFQMELKIVSYLKKNQSCQAYESNDYIIFVTIDRLLFFSNSSRNKMI